MLKCLQHVQYAALQHVRTRTCSRVAYTYGLQRRQLCATPALSPTEHQHPVLQPESSQVQFKIPSLELESNEEQLRIAEEELEPGSSKEQERKEQDRIDLQELLERERDRIDLQDIKEWRKQDRSFHLLFKEELLYNDKLDIFSSSSECGILSEWLTTQYFVIMSKLVQDHHGGEFNNALRITSNKGNVPDEIFKLQETYIESYCARFRAVQTVSKSRGCVTPGIDGIAFTSPIIIRQEMRLAALKGTKFHMSTKKRKYRRELPGRAIMTPTKVQP